jgi:serine/threonine protein kinase
MGEVYRGVDTILERQVAIKVLPDSVASDPERLTRFDREAKTLAALNHSNIAQIYGFEKANGIQALVMELVEGETLADRCARGPVPLDEAVTIARQIVEAVEAAHEYGIVHRDLKPANVRVRPDGVVKVLDFGLAKLVADSSGPEKAGPGTSLSPTITSPAMMTGVGVILGTAAYMSPEQANGYNVDRRTDVWSFGALLYELLTGRRAFPGESVSATVAAVLKLDPDWKALPRDTPDSIRLLLRRCLTKDRRQRLQAIGEALIALENPGTAPDVTPALPQSRRFPWAWLAAAVCAIALVAISVVHFGEKPVATVAPLERFEEPMPSPDVSAAIISPDGSRLVFWDARSRGQRGSAGPFFVRELNSSTARPLVGTTANSSCSLSLRRPARRTRR